MVGVRRTPGIARSDASSGRLFAILLAAVLSAARFGETPGRAQPAVATEYQVKAAFLYRFMQFVEWPKAASPEGEGSACLGVLGEDPFGSALDDVVRNENLNGRALVVRRSARAGDLRNCSLIFISPSEKNRVTEILSGLAGVPTLTVSEFDGFARFGGGINFFLEGKKVRFEINPTAARSHNLKIRSGLLKLGRIVEPDAPKGGGE